VYGKYLVAFGYYWGGLDCKFVYLIDEFIRTTNYAPKRMYVLADDHITLSDEGRFEHELPEYKQSFSFSLDEIYDNPKKIHDIMNDIRFTIMCRHGDFKDSILWRLVSSVDASASASTFTQCNITFEGDTQKEMIAILQGTDIINAVHTGNVSGNSLWWFIKGIAKKICVTSEYGPKSTYLVNETRLNHLMYLSIYSFIPIAQPFQGLNFRIVFNGTIRMNVFQKFVEIDEKGRDNGTLYSADDMFQCNVDFTRVNP
jgi:hypothetical protein